jgi:PAS domain S-box-containing protein
VQNTISTGNRQDIEYRIIRPDGQERFIHSIAELVLDKNGEKTGLVGVLQDITKRKEAEERLRSSEEKLTQEHNLLRTLIDTIPDSIYVKDTESRFVVANAFVAHVMGKKDPEELIGKSDFDFCHGEVAKILYATEQEIIRKGNSVINYEEPYTDKSNNKRRWYLTAKLPLKDDKGKITGIVGINRDITERKEVEERLKVSEEKLTQERNLLRTLIDTMPDSIYVKDAESRFLVANKKVAEVSGVDDPKELIGKTDADICKKKFAERYYADEQEIIRTGKGLVNYEEPFIDRVTGHGKWNLATKVPLRDGRGDIIGLVGINRDITERKRAESRIENLAKFPSEDPNPVIRITSKGEILYANDAGLKLVNSWTSGDGKKVNEEIHEIVAEVLSAGENKQIDIELGDSVLSLTFAPLVGMYYVNVYGFDITERNKIERLLEEKTRLNQILLDSFPCVALLMRPDSREIVASNEAAKKVGAVVGKKCFGTWTQQEEPCPFCLAPEVWASGEERHLEIEVKGTVWDAHWIPVSDDLYMHYVFDITQERRAEEEKRQRQAEMYHMSRLSTIGEMASGLAHEINQPLCAATNYINASLHLIKGGDGKKERIVSNMEASASQTKRAGDIVNSIKAFVKDRQPYREMVDMNKLIEGLSDLIIGDIYSKNVHLHYDFSEKTPLVFADMIQIEQVLTNLILNATEAMAETDLDGRHLTIKTRLADEEVEVSVTDTGKGLSGDWQENLFDSFFTTKGDGLGIGLSISRSIIEAHEGRLWAFNNENCGATFVFRLPAKKG